MTPDRLLALFDRVSEAPDAVPKLRRFVLNLAVRGKLVEQDPKDEPARLPNGLVTIAPQLPLGWQAASFGDVIDLQYGKSLLPAERLEAGRVSVFGSNGVVAFADVATSEAPAIIVGRKGSAGALNLCDGPSWTTDVAYYVVPAPWFEIRYLFSTLQSLDLGGLGKGVKPGLSRADVRPLVVLIPPVAEQRRIVARLDELMALCDQLEAARTDREHRRERLTTATFAAMTGENEPATEIDLPSTLMAVSAITTRSVQVTSLRHCVLDLAIRGKLASQDPSDEPASTILHGISDTRKRLVAERRAPRPKPLPKIEDLELPFILPSNWTWAMLGDLCYQVSDGPHFSPQYVNPEAGVPFLSTRNVRLDGFDLTTLKYVSHADHEEFCKRIRPEKGDILYTKGGTTGIAKVHDLDFDFSVWVHIAVLRIEKERLLPRYVELALNSPHCYRQSQSYTQGISNFDLGLTRMIKITIPLPPLAEQHRIVARVDELMALCDQLEASLTAADTANARLLDAILHEALNGAPQSEAA